MLADSQQEFIFENAPQQDDMIMSATSSSSSFNSVEKEHYHKRPRQYHRKDHHHLMPSTTTTTTAATTACSPHGKEKEEQVWPPDVEAAFIEALESIPKLGRRKILVNGKPCGRNELISDYIKRKTGKIRTRKQVSSHIQVLKNTRKGEPQFMRLLTDAPADTEDDTQNPQQQSQRPTKSSRPIGKQQPNNAGSSRRPSQQQPQQQQYTFHQATNSIISLGGLTSSESFSSCDDSSLSSSSSPCHDYVFDMLCNGGVTTHGSNDFLQMNGSTLQHPLFGDALQTLPTADITLDDPLSFTDPFMLGVDLMSTAVEAAGASAQQATSQVFNSNPSQQQQQQPPQQQQQQQLQQQLLMPEIKQRFDDEKMKKSPQCAFLDNSIDLVVGKEMDQGSFVLWPKYICFYLEYVLPHDPSNTFSHPLARMQDCYPNCLSKIPASSIIKQTKRSPLAYIVAKYPANIVLHAKTHLDLNLNLRDFYFNNNCFFESRDRRTIECTTTIYSFGNIVLESKEIQQALCLNQDRYIYSFAYVNQFFGAFMKGIRSLQTFQEIDVVIQNLCIVQVFEDVEVKYGPTAAFLEQPWDLSQQQQQQQHQSCNSPEQASPLLVMAYEFERGQGNMDISAVGDISKINKLGIGRSMEVDDL
ncbi:TEA-domain-containing protein [Lichtheimia hyalospora FSU 10163]|nr:TEA-domain-containing protein [Lichtheimia hyalospora FSU 10163]